jgi:hypothetical protein
MYKIMPDNKIEKIAMPDGNEMKLADGDASPQAIQTKKITRSKSLAMQLSVNPVP